MARRRPPKNRKKRSNKKGSRWSKITALIVGPALMLGGGGFGLYHYNQIEKIDEDFCYDRTTQAKTAVFLDYSVNPDLSNAQRRDLVTALERAYSDSPPNGKIMVFTTARDSAASIARPDFEICRPAETAAEQETIGAPGQTAPRLAHIAGEARARFLGYVDQILSDTRDDAKAARESPILATVQAISRHPDFQGRNRHFVWFSDGLENSETARFCQRRGDMPPAAKFVQRPGYEVVRPDTFEGAKVTVLLAETLSLPQPGLDFCDHKEMYAFWPELFELNGADQVRLRRLRRVAGS